MGASRGELGIVRSLLKRSKKRSILLLPPYRYKAEWGSNGVANNERDSRARPALQFYCMIYRELFHKSRHCAYVIYRVKTQFFKEDMLCPMQHFVQILGKTFYLKALHSKLVIFSLIQFKNIFRNSRQLVFFP